MTGNDDDDADSPKGSSASSGDDATLEGATFRSALQGRQIGRYLLGARIGAGAAGMVYRAHDPTIGRDVALKLIPADPIDSLGASDSAGSSGEKIFRREARAAGGLIHPSIVTLYDAGRDAEFYYLAMELVEGQTLEVELRERGRLGIDRGTALGAAVARALHFAHKRGVVHRDVKPSNLLLPRGGSIKIADFGIAHLTQANIVTTDGSFIGTPNYVSPEQLKGLDVDGRADLFSLGIVLYEALTGRHPFRGASIAATLNAILTVDPVPAHRLCDDVSEGLSRVLAKSLAKEPGRRFGDGDSLARALLGEDREADAEARPSISRRAFLVLAATFAGVGVAAYAIHTITERKGLPGDGSGESAEQPPPASRPLAAAVRDGDPRVERITLGVMLFQPLTPSSDSDWMREALRESFNTELSQLSAVKVYAKEFVDFLIRRKNLSEIEAMTELGVAKMLSGSFTIVDDSLQITTRIVDVRTGVLDASYVTIGHINSFFDLRNRIVLEAIDRLNLQVSTGEREALVARQRASVGNLKRFLAAEGTARNPGASRDASERPSDEPSSALPRWIARALDAATAPAVAGENPENDVAIRELLERYRRAMEKRDLDEMGAIYLGYSDDQRDAQAAYFENIRDLRVVIADIEIVAIGDEGVVSFTRTDDFVDRETGEPMHMVVRLTKAVEKREGIWRMRSEG
jgi:eukaryotic-like serine/threonine-protein kinase